jgi:hypothetical protein
MNGLIMLCIWILKILYAILALIGIFSIWLFGNVIVDIIKELFNELWGR